MTQKKTVILIVEDEALLLEAISRKISKLGHNSISCSSGHEALKVLKEKTSKPDAIWLDFYLGDMDGYEFMKEIKAKENSKNIPVAVVSNSASPEKIKKMASLGAEKYFLKAHYRIEEIISGVNQLIANQ